MKVLAFQGSPRAKNSNTNMIVQPFLEGARQAGASTETFYLSKLKITPCQGCLDCWMKTPGICSLKDDMGGILEKILESDIIVFATPLYNCTMTAYMKAFIERLLPLENPRMKIINGHPAHVMRYPDKNWKWVLISNAARPDQKCFDNLLDGFQRKSHVTGGGLHTPIVGTILRVSGLLMAAASENAENSILPFDLDIDWFFEACIQAGKEVVELGKITQETHEILHRPFMDMKIEEIFEMGSKALDVLLADIE